MDFEDGAFELLQVGDHLEEVACLRVSLRAEHPHQALGRLRHPPGIMEAGDPMDKTIRKFNSFAEVKDEEYLYWQSVPPAERIEAAYQLSVEQYRMKGIEPDGSALKRSLVRVECPRS